MGEGRACSVCGAAQPRVARGTGSKQQLPPSLPANESCAWLQGCVFIKSRSSHLGVCTQRPAVSELDPQRVSAPLEARASLFSSPYKSVMKSGSMAQSSGAPGRLSPAQSPLRLKSLAQESPVHPDSYINPTPPPACSLTPEKRHEMRGLGSAFKIPISTGEQKLGRTPDPEPLKVQGIWWGCRGGPRRHQASVAVLPLGTEAAVPCVCPCGGRAALRATAELAGCSAA